jgi:hypothetical protein
VPRTPEPREQLYIFPDDLRKSLAADRAAIGGNSVQASQQYTFKMGSMAPTVKKMVSDKGFLLALSEFLLFLLGSPELVTDRVVRIKPIQDNRRLTGCRLCQCDFSLPVVIDTVDC